MRLWSRKWIMCIVTVIAVGATMIMPTMAASVQKQITATYGIKLNFNDEEKTLTDANGTKVEPFVYQGTTYVPIRSISELFGASVGYDKDTNSAVIYDDFAEVCAVANKMESIVSDAYMLVIMEMKSATSKSLDDYSSMYQECDDEIEKMYDTLLKIVEDNVNENLIVNEIVPEYQKFLISFVQSHQAYEALRKYQSSYYANKYVDVLHEVIDNYYAAKNAVEGFFEDYCMWRDLGM